MDFFFCDDDTKILNLYAEKVKLFCQKNNIPCDISLYRDAERFLFDFDPYTFRGILFLNIFMPGLDGISIAKKLKRESSRWELIILVDSKDHYLKAFDVGDFSYIIKGAVTDQHFAQILDSAITEIRIKEQRRILFSAAGEYRSIAISDIQYFEITQRIVTVHYGDGETFDFYSSLGKLETQLIGCNFIRIHNSYLVALSQVHKLTTKRVELYSGKILPVGPTYQKKVKAIYSQQSDIDISKIEYKSGHQEND